MTERGLPWDADVHRQILTEVLGPEPADGQRPARLAELAARISDAFGFPVNPDSPGDVKEAFRRHGFELESTRAWVLREIDHPAVAPLLDYKDRARLYTANGWHWLAEWISGEGRLAAQFLPGAVVSGRWATRGGGGLQLPASIRRAAVARDGHALVVADAAQLEPRILAAVSGDAALTQLSTGPDLYAALAADGFGGDRRHAKLAMLGAMYGQTSGEAARLMATMRVRYPAAVGHVEAAALRGETGAVVQSVLGRACPPPSDSWRRLVGGGADGANGGARRAARDRGRVTRNFVIQASAADWAAVWMTTLRLALMDEVPGAEIVFFQHDELVVHVAQGDADRVSDLVVAAAERARDLVFPGSQVLLPVRPSVVRCYADAK
jgi:DNA polymerase-1